MHKQTIGVFFGSRSAEHDVSIITALAAVIKPLEATGDYHVVPVYIAKDGRWFSEPELAEITTYQGAKIDEILVKRKPVQLQLGNGLTIIKPGVKAKKITIDVAFPATHGTFGEDGALMGLFEMAGVPYVGCDAASSAIAMNKVTSKLIAESAGIPIAPFQFFTAAEFKQDPAKLVHGLTTKSPLRSAKMPLFVKPAHLGSSIGISRVSDLADLQNAIEVACHYDNLVLVEEGIHNLIEVTVPIMGNNQPRTALVERPLTNPEDFFDFDKKYLGQGKKGGAKETGSQGAQGYSEIPAKLPGKLYELSEKTALAVYRALGCQDIARIDLLIDKKAEKVYFNEVNPLPGSLYTHNWQKAGVPAVELVHKLIQFAEERAEQQAKLNRSFDTSFLKQF